MAVTASRLRAVVSAETAQAQAQMKAFGRTVSDTAATSRRDLSGLASLVSGDLSGVFAAFGVGAAATAVAGMARMGVALNNQREIAANVRRELTAYAGSSTTAAAATRALLQATEGGVTQLQAMSSASKLLSMGLADSAEDVGQLARMAVMLGDKTMTAQQRMESFNLMLANQSIERLDTFGIASGRARQKIDELMASTAGLSREQAFVNTVLEMGAEKLDALEREGVEATTSVDKLTSAWGDLRQAAADKVHLQVVIGGVAEAIGNLATAIGPGGAAEREYARAFDAYRQAVERTAQAQEHLGGWYAKVNPLARANYEVELAQAQAAEAAALASYRLAQELQDIALNGDRAAGGMSRAATAAWALRAAQGQGGAGAPGTTTGTFTEPSKTRWGLYTDWARQQQGSNAGDLVKDWIERVKGGNTAVVSDYEKKMQDAFDDLAADYQSAMQEGINFSKGLSDLGGGNPNAPGQNGAFENIYRLQAFIKDGSWGETANQFGLDQGSAAEIVKKFQQGIWDQSVMAVIDKGKLTEQIQNAQLGKTMMDAVAADLAKETGGDPKLIKAMLGMGGGEGEGAAIDVKGFIPGFLSGVDKALLDSKEDLARRGAGLWSALGDGFVEAAESSATFNRAVTAMVNNALKDALN